MYELILKHRVRGDALISLVALVVFLIASVIALKGLFFTEMDWHRYKTLFISEQGRVIDTGNGGISHSEGQGWGMLLAVENNDKATFERLWNWTQTHLQIRSDSLFSWRWMPVGLTVPVTDKNNASDGDIYIAWALLRAGERWGEVEYSRQSLAIVTDIRTQLIRQYGGMTILLPAQYGFVHDQHILINLSYWVFAAFEEFNRIDPNPVWSQLRQGGVELLTKARFGRWNLPPDWAALTAQGELQLATDFPPRFSYDAIRVPLALYWGRVGDKQLLQPYHELYSSSLASAQLPGWIDLNDASNAPYDANDAFKGILALASNTSIGEGNMPEFPPISENYDYYTASLVMLTQQAIAEVKQ